jgi:hypothetical protein
MKKTVFIVALFSVIYLAGFAIPQQAHPVKQKRDTTRDINNQPKPKYIKGRAARMRLQEKQIRYHDKQLKKVDSAQKKLNRELQKKGS